jgi:hypothetical protein
MTREAMQEEEDLLTKKVGQLWIRLKRRRGRAPDGNGEKLEVPEEYLSL